MSNLKTQAMGSAMDVFNKLSQSFKDDPYPSAKRRIAGLNKLKANLESSKSELRHALFEDLGKSAFEAEATDFTITLLELKDSIRELKYWMQDESVTTPWALTNTYSYIRKYPKGVVLIIAPWNYPILLCIVPIIAAYAAGNKIVVKPSEFAPASERYLSKLLSSSFSSDEVQMVHGDASIGAELTQLPFNHIFFTGGKNAAKEIVKASAEHLTPLTLELGGKSPVIILDDAELDNAARNIAFAKCLNSGQTCLAPDYILVPASLEKLLIQKIEHYFNELYGPDILSGEVFAKIINVQHFKRLCDLLEDAKSKGATIIPDIAYDEKKLKIHPCIVPGASAEMKLMQEEIFGPILPILSYEHIEEALCIIEQLPRPLACYIFGQSDSKINSVLNNTRSGGVTINNCLLNFCNIHLPFGGDGESGYGNYHGKYGFNTFSHSRSVTVQRAWIEGLRFFMPPFTKIKFMIKMIVEKIS